MAKYKIVLLPGDGIGPEVMKEAEKVLDTISEGSGLDFELTEIPCGYSYHHQMGAPWPEGTFEVCRDESDAVLLGAVGQVNKDAAELQLEHHTPGGWIVFGLRAGLDLFANVRPVKLYPNINHQISGEYKQVWQPENVNFVIVRENTEGLYATAMAGWDKESLIFEKKDKIEDPRIITEYGAKRVIEFAFDMAKNHSEGAPVDNKKRLTCVDKSNVLMGCKLFRYVYNEVAEQYPAIEKDYAYIDAFVQWLLRKPEHYNVVVTPNMFGDISTDLAAVLQGGLGMAPSGNLGEHHAMFEPVHGAAPRHVGKNSANPIGMILSVNMMLQWLGERKGDNTLFKVSEKLEMAVTTVLQEGKIRTPDINGISKCSEVGNAISGKLLELLNR